MDACCLTFIITKNQKVGGGQKSAYPKGPYFYDSCHFRLFEWNYPHFQSSTKATTRYMSIFVHNSILFLKTTSITNPKGGPCYTCMFIFLWGHTQLWPKRGACALNAPPPRSTDVMCLLVCSCLHFLQVTCAFGRKWKVDVP